MVSKGRREVCCALITISSLTALFMWLTFRPSEPRLSIEHIYIPSLNKTANDTLNTTISFDLKLKNHNRESRIYYDALNVTLYYGPNLSSSIGNVTIPAFRQGHWKKAHRKETIKAIGVPWNTAIEEDSNGTVAVFRVDLQTKVRYKDLFHVTKRHELKVGGNVRVNDQGVKIEKKGIKLSCASALACNCARVVFFVLFVGYLF